MNESAYESLSRSTLFEALADEALAPTVWCTSRRLAQALQREYGDWQHARGVDAWPTPAIQTMESFLQAQAAARQRRHLAAPLPAPLSEHESDLLWRLVVDTSSASSELLRPGEAAQLAAQAWRLCRDYALPSPLPTSSADVEQFNQWAQAYVERCAALGRLDAAQAREALLAAMAQDGDGVPRRVVLSGFDQLIPWQRQLLALVAQHGGEVWVLEAAGVAPATVGARVAVEAGAELYAAAQWVRQVSEAQPQARIGIVVPDLGARREDLQRVFDETLCPSVAALPSPSVTRPYNLSLGLPLPQHGLVHAALALLRLCVSGLALPAAGGLLCSPYWGQDESQRLQRAELDRRLREEGHLQVDLAVLLRLLPAASEEGHSLAGDLRRLQAARSSSRLDPGEWVERFSQWLELAGWPGPRPLDSTEYQLLQAWRELLGALGALGGVLGSIPASGALHQLEVLAQRRVFQPQTPELRIQVLGALEAQGLSFDALWVMGLDDERWPPGGRPNPYIPFELQRRHGLPHASTAHELAWAERMTQRWRAAASEVVFSWAAREGERPLSPSPLIQPEAAQAREEIVDALSPRWRELQRHAAFEQRADAYAPPPSLQQPVPGGARLLGDQARCPFRAFTTHRLGASTLEQPGYGVSPIDRGELVHRSLETIWRQLRTHAALSALDEAALSALIGDTVDAELARLHRQAPQRLTPGLQRLEARRLRDLLTQWLRLEQARPPFAVALLEGSAPEAEGEAHGDEQLVAFGGLHLRLRPDRVDRLDGGDELVIDYKTGAKRPLPWHDGRPEEPQLLIYALTRPQTVAVAYGRLRQGSVGFDGIADDGARVDGVKGYEQIRETRDASSWDGLMGRWRGELETVADEIKRGLASVTPKHPRQSCADCHLHAVCRIHEATDALSQDDDADLAGWDA